jgi:hypothetical protein
MKRARPFACIVTILLSLNLLLTACSVAPYQHEPLQGFDLAKCAVTQQHGAFRVRTTVPGEEESRGIFGVSLYDRGIQPIWLEVTNLGQHRGRLVLASIDPDYFSPLEVAYMYRKKFSKQGWQDMERYLFANALPRQIPPGKTVSGFIFTQAGSGTKAFNVDIFSTARDAPYEQFTFFVEVPGFKPDHASVEFESLYNADEIKQLDTETLWQALETFPCCTSNRDGTAQGRPLQLFLVAEGGDLLRALLRSGWEETSYVRDENYLKKADYLYGRPPDTIFRKRRDKTTERASLALWLAPMTVNEEPVWVGLFKHTIGRRYEIGEILLGVSLDPDTSDGRNYVLQDLWYSQSMQHWGWSDTGTYVPQSDPVNDFNGNPWFAKDRLRLVIWVSGDPVSMSEASNIGPVKVKAIDFKEDSP